MKQGKGMILKIIRKLKKLIFFFFKKGPIYTFKVVVAKLRGKSDNTSLLYQELIIDDKEAEKQRIRKFAYEPVISVLVPLYNTNEIFFQEMITSVCKQTYQNWELVLADASDDTESFRKLYLDTIKDDRIKYYELPKNLGIVGNSNRAFYFATGAYIGLLDHDDVLAIDCLYEVVKAINDKKATFVYTDEITFKKKLIHAYQPNLKPDFSPDTLRSYNYICHFSCFSRDLIHTDEALFNENCEGSQDYDLILRLTERTKEIVHIEKVLYFWRAHEQSTAQNIDAKPYTMDAARIALQNHLLRIGLKGTVDNASIPTTYRIDYEIDNPLISIIIPNKDHQSDLEKCINSIEEKSTYTNYEIIIVENNSNDAETFSYYSSLKLKEHIKIISYNDEFNYSAINNMAAKEAFGEYLVLLNNDIEIITKNWLEELLMYAQRDDIGCVGCRLLYPDNTVQHAGVIIGIGSVAGHAHKNLARNDYGFMSRLQIVQNLSAVTAACMMIKKIDFMEVHGFDEEIKVAFNDVDLCLRVEATGKYNIYTPFAEAYHYESKSRGLEDDANKIARFQSEIKYFENRWGLYRRDPFYNRYLSLEKEDFSLKLSTNKRAEL